MKTRQIPIETTADAIRASLRRGDLEDTLSALEGSVEKWQRIYDGRASNGGPDDCPLCQMFLTPFQFCLSLDERAKQCLHCPVALSVGETNCRNTPYQTYWHNPTKHNAGCELLFLQNLLDTWQTTLDSMHNLRPDSMRHKVNRENIERLMSAVVSYEAFDMCEHRTCLIGCAARIDGEPDYNGDTLTYNSKDLAIFLGIDWRKDEAEGGDVRGDLYLRSAATKADAIVMLANLRATGEVVWPTTTRHGVAPDVEK